MLNYKYGFQIYLFSFEIIATSIFFAENKHQDLSRYQYDEASGYYYDPSSGLYYDPSSQYFYDADSKQFCYWDSAKNMFIPVTEPSSVDDSTKKDGRRMHNEKYPLQNKVQAAKMITKV